MNYKTKIHQENRSIFFFEINNSHNLLNKIIKIQKDKFLIAFKKMII